MASSAFGIDTIIEATLVMINLVLFSYGYPDASRTALSYGRKEGVKASIQTRSFGYISTQTI
jgi:hypothetical protein